MRGKDTIHHVFNKCCRITPAYAGKSGLRSKVERNDGDHPRLCGEKRWECDVTNGIYGSPPPMRGKVGNGLEPDFVHGITPAYAGKSLLELVAVVGRRDHPRLCGEKGTFRHRGV